MLMKKLPPQLPLYRFIGFGRFMKQVSGTRLINMAGFMGTGKTLFSVALGFHMVRYNYVTRASFNLPISFGKAPHWYRSYNVLDEAGVLFENRNYRDKELNEMSKAVLYALRKNGSYIVTPSYLDTDKRFRKGALRMYRVFPLPNQNAPIWLFRWEVGPEEIEERNVTNFKKGYLAFIRPAWFYNTYCTYYAPNVQLSRQFVTKCIKNEDLDEYFATQ